RPAEVLLPRQSDRQSARHHHRGGVPGVRRRVRPLSEPESLPRPWRRLRALSGGPLGARLGGAARAEEDAAAFAQERDRPLHLRHHPALEGNAGISGALGRPRPRAARQRLSLRHGDARLRPARALAGYFRRRQGDHPAPPGRNPSDRGAGRGGGTASEARMNEMPRPATPAAASAARGAPAAEPQRVPASAIVSLIADALAAVDFPAADARRIGELMTEADLTGADAHGVFRLSQYVERARAGGLNRRPNITVNRTAPATALVDGDNGMGHLVVARAAETAIELAREAGVAWVGARNSNHAGAAGVYAAM